MAHSSSWLCTGYHWVVVRYITTYSSQIVSHQLLNLAYSSFCFLEAVESEISQPSLKEYVLASSWQSNY